MYCLYVAGITTKCPLRRGVCLLHPSVTDPVEPDPVDYFPLPSENLASPVPSEYFDFTQLFLCFPSDCAV